MAGNVNKSFASLTSKFTALKRSGDSKQLAEFMGSQKLFEALAALSNEDRLRIQTHMQAAFRACARGRPKLVVPRYSKRIWRGWDETRIQRLKTLYNATGSDRAVAAKMGISLDAARRARLRYIGGKTALAVAA